MLVTSDNRDCGTSSPPTSRGPAASFSLATGEAITEAGSMGRSPDGFVYEVRSNGSILIKHHGRVAATLRGPTAARFLVEVEDGDEQEVMARVTGNYKRGNERAARNHPRNHQR